MIRTSILTSLSTLCLEGSPSRDMLDKKNELLGSMSHMCNCDFKYIQESSSLSSPMRETSQQYSVDTFNLK